MDEEGREEEEEEGEEEEDEWGESARSPWLQHDAIVYIDSVTVRELFVLTVERPSQQAITTISVPQPRIVSAAWE